MKWRAIIEEHALKASTFAETSHTRGRDRGRGWDNKDEDKGRER